MKRRGNSIGTHKLNKRDEDEEQTLNFFREYMNTNENLEK